MSPNILAIFYLISGVLFILALRVYPRLKHQDGEIYLELLEWLLR